MYQLTGRCIVSGTFYTVSPMSFHTALIRNNKPSALAVLPSGPITLSKLLVAAKTPSCIWEGFSPLQ